MRLGLRIKRVWDVMIRKLTAMNFLTLLATSAANFALEIGRRLAVKSTV